MQVWDAGIRSSVDAPSRCGSRYGFRRGSSMDAWARHGPSMHAWSKHVCSPGRHKLGAAWQGTGRGGSANPLGAVTHSPNLSPDLHFNSSPLFYSSHPTWHSSPAPPQGASSARAWRPTCWPPAPPAPPPAALPASGGRYAPWTVPVHWF